MRLHDVPTVSMVKSHGGASDLEIALVENVTGRHFPADYKEVLREHNGLECFVGKKGYLALWSTAEVLELNQAYAVAEFAPGLTLIGANGGNDGYGLAEVDGETKYVTVPLVGMETESVQVLGNTFVEFLSMIG